MEISTCEGLHDIFVPGLNKIIQFYIGKNAKHNNCIIDNASENDIWFHVKDLPSCHIIAVIPEDIIDKKDLRYIIKRGALLCKSRSKYSNIKKLDIVYTYIKNIVKTEIEGTINILEDYCGAPNEKIITR
jgi:predicted ribosome quality control (RQC) complex YloA/Tae2 family protein